MDIQSECISAYRLHKNLKLAANDVGIPWQSVYVHLRKAGEPVTGDKLRYGSDKDRLAARGEQLFLGLVPFAEDQNLLKFQSKVDFLVCGHKVDVKISTLKFGSKLSKIRRWSFSVKKQEFTADFMVCIGLNQDDETIQKVILIPGEIIRRYTTVSLSEVGGKWDDYVIPPHDLASFFSELPAKSA